MAELDGGDVQVVFEQTLLRAAAEKMRAAADLIDGGTLPSDEGLTDAGVLCADAGSLIESVYDERVAAMPDDDIDADVEDEGEARA